MAIEPIKGFYVHDEVTDTDGVAKYSAEQLAGDVPEVKDIRIGYNRNVFESAGDAVRAQGDIFQQIATEKTSKNLLNTANATSGILYPNGSTTTSTHAYYTWYIPVESGKYIKCSYRPSATAAKRFSKNITTFTAYDDALNVLTSKGASVGASYFLVPDGVSFVRVTIGYFSEGVELMLELSDTSTIVESVEHYEQYFDTYYEAKSDVTDADLDNAKAECKDYATTLVNDAITSIELPSQVGVLSYTIEQFEGETLEDKLHTALNTIARGVITCGNVTLTKKYTPVNNKNYRGITIADSVLTIGIDGWWDGEPTGQYNYCPQFKNCVITCVNGNAVFDATDNTVLVSPTFMQCYFQSPVISKNETLLVQSLRVENCEFQTSESYSYTFCTGSQFWDFNFISNRYELGKGMLLKSTYSGTGYAVYHAIFRNNVIEGRQDKLFELGRATDIQFQENYFEHNKNPYFNITALVDLFVFKNNYVNEGSTEDAGCFVITQRPTAEVIRDNALLLLGSNKVLVRYA